MKRTIITIAGGLAMLACALCANAAPEATFHAPRIEAVSTSLSCEGSACAQVTLTFDEAKRQY
jgi:hypothetical protein